jgi:hypothetical protein
MELQCGGIKPEYVLFMYHGIQIGTIIKNHFCVQKKVREGTTRVYRDLPYRKKQVGE